MSISRAMELGRSYAPELFDRGSKRNRKLLGTGSLAVVEDMTDKPGGAFGALTRGERRHPRHAPAQSHAIPSSASTEGFERPPARQTQHQEGPCTIDKS